MEQEFYHVSLREFEKHQKLNLVKQNVNLVFHSYDGFYDQNETENHLRQIFPNGVTNHGIKYLGEKHSFVNHNNNSYIEHTSLVETTFELYRQAHHRDKPSRFTSLYGCETYEDALIYNKKYKNDSGIIYKVKSESFFKADMSLLLIGHCVLGNLVLAEKYWSGQQSKNPFWEILLVGEVEMLERVK